MDRWYVPPKTVYYGARTISRDWTRKRTSKTRPLRSVSDAEDLTMFPSGKSWRGGRRRMPRHLPTTVFEFDNGRTTERRPTATRSLLKPLFPFLLSLRHELRVDIGRSYTLLRLVTKAQYVMMSPMIRAKRWRESLRPGSPSIETIVASEAKARFISKFSYSVSAGEKHQVSFWSCPRPVLRCPLSRCRTYRWE